MEYLRRTLDVETLKQEISDAVIQKLRDAGLLTLSVGWGWPIGKLMQRIYDFPREFALQQSSTLQTITEMLFHTTGDRRRNFDREYNTTRDAFVSEYGSSGAKGLCAYLIRKHELDFDEGVTEEELQDVILSGLIHMILLLMHEDVTHKETKLAIQFTDDFQFRAKVVRDKPIQI